MTDAPISAAPRILDVGEAALVVEFGTSADPATSDRVLALGDALVTDRLAGIAETVPTDRQPPGAREGAAPACAG